MIKRITFLFTGLMVFGITKAQDQKLAPASGTPSQKAKNAKVQYGTASFYANKFDGRSTANGDVFSQKKMTAASNTISLNTWVKVTNLHNKKSAVVKITDRMHPKNKRLIDLSRSAASQLGYTGRGLARVKVELLGKKRPAGWSPYPQKPF
jgi:rare lipoprotein A